MFSLKKTQLIRPKIGVQDKENIIYIDWISIHFSGQDYKSDK